MISSAANIGERPARRQSNKVVIPALTFMVIAIVVEILIISAKKPSLGSSGANPAGRSSAPADQHPQ
jgi:hypothetical protein